LVNLTYSLNGQTVMVGGGLNMSPPETWRFK